jgi:hypothetical protein
LIRSDETFVDLSRIADVAVVGGALLPISAVELFAVVVATPPSVGEDDAASIERKLQLINNTNNTRYLIDFIVFSHPIVGMEICLQLCFRALRLAFHYFSNFSHNFHNDDDALHFGV